MTEVIHTPSSSLQTNNDTPLFQDLRERVSRVTDSQELNARRERDNQQLSLLAFLLTLFRKSFWVASSCKTTTAAQEKQDLSGMEIGWPTNVRHIAHVTFDRFNGFLGLPVEFEPGVPRRAPSASATVFGVSIESMQLSHDFRGNSIPTILLLMQQRLYSSGGLQAEGIFRISSENSEEEYLRNELNSGVVPDGIDVHCLAGLIKAWFRELPTGVLDPLSPEQVMQCQSEENCAALVRLLPPTEAALLDWAVNLMADVVQQEHANKMNSHNIAMVFAPNMTQMADPLTALMYAVQVMNFLKTLVAKTLREREESVMESSSPAPPQGPLDENGHQGFPFPLRLCHSHGGSEEIEEQYMIEDPVLDSSGSDSILLDNITDDDHLSYSTTTEESDGPGFYEVPVQTWHVGSKTRGSQSSGSDKSQVLVLVVEPIVEKSTRIDNLSSINSPMERSEIWIIEPGNIFDKTPMKSDDDLPSSFSDMFSELHFMEKNDSVPSSTKQTNYYQYHHQCNASMNAESFSMCTEGLGCESFDDVEYLKDQDFNDQYCKHQQEQKRCVSSSPDEMKRMRIKGLEFPPPISSIGTSGKPWVRLESYRSNGRFVLKEVKILTQELLHTCREEGRLKLHFVQSDDETLHEVNDDEGVKSSCSS